MLKMSEDPKNHLYIKTSYCSLVEGCVIFLTVCISGYWHFLF